MTTQRTAAGSSIGLVIAAALAAAAPAVADAQPTCTPRITNWTSFDVPGASSAGFGNYPPLLFTGTQPATINGKGEIAGTWEDQSFVNHGFIRRPDGTIESFDPPNGAIISVRGLNNRGAIVGSSWDTQSPEHEHGFIRSADGGFTFVDDPDPSAAGTYVSAINDRGVAVGSWYGPPATTTSQGFVRDRDGSITNIDGSYWLVNINDSGEASGVTSSRTSGLLLHRDGERVIWAPPQAPSGMSVSGLNMEGSVAGYYYANEAHAFVRHPNGNFTEVPPSDPTYTYVFPQSINNRGTVVGYEVTTPGGSQQGLAQLADGAQVLVTAPVALQGFLSVEAINNGDVMTGHFYDPGAGMIHGFVATLVSCQRQ